MIRRLKTFTFSPASVPLILLLVSLASYGLMLPWLGFYWDDQVFNWITQVLGSSGLTRYFATNRPVLGLLYQVTTRLLGGVPWHWQVFALFWRWMAGVMVWTLVRRVWPSREWAAAAASLLFVVYPGFEQQFIAIIYGHFFLVLTAFLGSLVCTVAAYHHTGWRRWVLTGVALILGLANLLMIEYFFVLELLRPVLVWIALQQQESGVSIKPRFKKMIQVWWPYALVFTGAVVWRAFFFRFQTQNYNISFLGGLLTNPGSEVLALLGNIFRDMWLAGLAAWGQVFSILPEAGMGFRTLLASALLIAVVVLTLFVYLSRMRGANTPAPLGQKLAGWSLVMAGLVGLFLAGWPFWLTNLVLTLGFPSDRFTLPFIIGSCLVVAGLFEVIPATRWSKAVLLSVLVGFAVGWQFQLANAYRRDWATERTFFWQLSWRIPDLQPGTALLANELPLLFSSDNSLSAPLNWLYAPQNRSDSLDTMLFYPARRLNNSLPGLEKGLPIKKDYLVAAFSGSTSQVVAIYFKPSVCLRVLDHVLDADNLLLPEPMRQVATLSDSRFILPASPGNIAHLPETLTGPEPAHNWCYYFEKADWASQQGDWAEVVNLGDRAFTLTDHPNDPAEQIPFIEGYAHTGNWSRARELTHEARQITPHMDRVMCLLWQRIDRETPASPEKTAAVQAELSDCEQ